MPTIPTRSRFRIDLGERRSRATQAINIGEGGNDLFIQEEHVIQRTVDGIAHFARDERGNEFLLVGKPPRQSPLSSNTDDGQSILNEIVGEHIERWQFLSLVPDAMGQPTPQQRAAGRIRLAKNGANIAEYLNEIRKLSLDAFNGLLASVRYVLHYAVDLQPTLTSELERAFYLKLKEEHFEVPGWLLSTGTLRIVALLACLRHPEPPPLLIVEEIENGLDPRTIHLLVEEIRAAITTGTTQVIATTHSPYLLDLLDLSQIVVVEREKGQPTFRRLDEAQLKARSKSFSPGRLYTMGQLTRGN